MSSLTSKELSALEDQMNHEQTLVKKYQAMACLCNDTKMAEDLNGYAAKHQQHFNTLLTFLQEGVSDMSNPDQCAQLLDEKEILQDALISQKLITGSYNTYAGEAVSAQLRNTMLSILDDEHAIQADIFSSLQSHGWYKAEPAEQQKIVQTRQKFTTQ